jgi:hypothetical protein
MLTFAGFVTLTRTALGSAGLQSIVPDSHHADATLAMAREQTQAGTTHAGTRHQEDQARLAEDHWSSMDSSLR